MIKTEFAPHPRPRRPLATALLTALLVTCAATAASAAPAAVAEPASLTGDFKSAIVIDAETDMVLAETNAHERRQPASMLKMMTELIVLEHVREGDLAFADRVKISGRSSNMGGSQVYLKHGEEFSVEELLQALAIHSANDAAVALAEHVAGSVVAFVDLMNLRARELGMNDTEFHSVHGLPAGRGQKPDLTTARDLATLARELVTHPEALVWASTETAPFRGGEFTLYNPNKLVGKYRGLDGLKTGYTGPAGFCVTATAIQKGKRLISVVMGCGSDRARATETTRLLTFGFNAYEQIAIIPEAGAPLAAPVAVREGKRKEAAVAFGEALTVSVPRSRGGDLVVDLRLATPLAAPLVIGQEVGRAFVLLDGRELGSVPLVATEEVPRGNWLDRLLD